jgi:hypothetical protein
MARGELSSGAIRGCGGEWKEVFMDVLIDILSALVDGWAVTGSWKWSVVLVAVGAIMLVSVVAIR